MPTRIELVRRTIESPTAAEKALAVRGAVLAAHPELGQPRSHTEDKFGVLFGDLKKGKAWGPMSILDGPAKGDLDHPERWSRVPKEEYDLKRQEARAWTRQAFTTEQLHTLTAGIVDVAINPTDEQVRTAPGYARGHSLLLRHMVEKPGSIFPEFLTPEAPKALANGAFWEELGSATAPDRVEDILLDHGQELDPALAAEYIPLYERNRGLTTYSHVKHETDMGRFTTEGLTAYLEFIKKVAAETNLDGNLAVDPKLIDQLVLPYLLGTLHTHPEDPNSLRFQVRYDFEKLQEIKPEMTYQAVFGDSLVQASIARSERTQKFLGARLAELLDEPWGDQPGPEAALDVFDQMGNESRTVMKATIEAIAKKSSSNLSQLAELLENMSQRHPIAEVGLYILDEIEKAKAEQ